MGSSRSWFGPGLGPLRGRSGRIMESTGIQTMVFLGLFSSQLVRRHACSNAVGFVLGLAYPCRVVSTEYPANRPVSSWPAVDVASLRVSTLSKMNLRRILCRVAQFHSRGNRKSTAGTPLRSMPMWRKCDIPLAIC